MASSNPSQLSLLSDHIKLSLLERQRALSLNLSPNTQNAEISRSLDSFRTGLDKLDAEHAASTPAPDAIDHAARLRKQYNDLLHQFDGSSPPPAALAKPNDPQLAQDFKHAQQRTTPSRPHSSLKRQPSGQSKSVRFTDNPNEEEANRAALMPYSDEPEEAPDHGHLDNQQIHAYHSRVIREQDTQLESLGASIGRTRELSIQIGDELDDQMEILGDVEAGVDRHQTQLTRARTRVDKIAKKAKENWSWLTISILVIILILLLIVTK